MFNDINIHIYLKLIQIMKEKCSLCGQEENHPWLFGKCVNIYTCDFCGKRICTNCVKEIEDDGIKYLLGSLENKYKEEEMNLCPECNNIYKRDYSKMRTAYLDNSDVEIVSINYKGKKEVSGEKYRIKSDFNCDKDVSLDELKSLARYLGCDIVIDVEFERDTDYEETESGGTYNYSVWRYSGIATHKVKWRHYPIYCVN